MPACEQSEIDAQLRPALEALDRILDEGKLELPLLPEVVLNVVRLCNDPDCEPRALADLIRRDPALMAHVLRLVNSAAEGATVPIVSLQLAVGRLGLARIRQLALAVACRATVFAGGQHSAAVQALFRRSVAAAAAAEEIARMRRQNVEEAFIAGLLHDVGHPILLPIVLGLGNDERVEELARLRHEEIGGRLIAAWNLPDRIAAAIRHHHHPEGGGAAESLARVLRLADDTADAFLGDAEPALEGLHTHQDLEPLNLYPEDVERLLGRRESILQTVELMA